ncbi:g9887 [Coccomyxa viridis]|uniref:G9887 protein n=1 Tax=Coccomyxa viridis TaxID=1274662 RepID=A0ABP1G6Q0_9CHLO
MGNLATAAYAVSFCCSVVSWLVLLIGTGAVYGVCPEACIYYFGLSWWAIWFQFIILVASIPVGLLGAKAWKNPVLALLAINTAIAMKQTDGFLSTKLVDPTYASYPGRMNTTIAGFGLVSIFNVFLILALGVADEEVRAPTNSIRSAYSGSACAPLA